MIRQYRTFLASGESRFCLLTIITPVLTCFCTGFFSITLTTVSMPF